MTNLVLNDQLKGVEIYFDNKPSQTIIDSLKSNGFRWHSFKKCWYAKQSEKTMQEANRYVQPKEEIQPQTEKVKTNETIETTQKISTNKESKNNISLPLWDLTRWTEQNNLDKNLSTKEIASTIRKEVRNRFPMCKFSITSEYSSISFYIVSSPYEKESIYLKAIEEYCTNLLKSYNYCTSYDPYGDYGSSYNFYGSYAKIDYQYKQTEQTETIKADMLDFEQKLAQSEKEEEEKREKEYQVSLIQQEEDKKAYEQSQQEERNQVQIIYNSVTITDLNEENQYFVLDSQFANLNKNNTLNQYKEEIAKNDFELQNVKITKEIHFTNNEALSYFSNLLLDDFTFLEETGGSYTDDYRINTMTDYYQMAEEERKTVIFNRLGVAVYYNNQLQFVIDTQGYSYSRYVGLTDNAKIKKNNPIKQLINPEQLQELKDKAETLTDLSTEAITCDNNLLNTWDKEDFPKYKNRMKQVIKKNNFKLTKSIIQQLPEEQERLKIAMYKLLTEVDGIQDQFKNADLKQGQKVTLFYISDFGSMVEKRITIDKIEYTKYAQYNNAVKLTFKPEGKRKFYYNYWYSQILVYEGWPDLPKTVLHDISTSNSFVITKTKYLSCDKQQYDEVLQYFESQGIKPVINTYKPLF